MKSVDVALACCRRLSKGDPTDLYPDLDAAPLRAALSTIGAASVQVSWDDPSVDWGSFTLVVVSSTWDSVDRPDEYLSWARRVSALSVLVNPVAIIEWGLEKTHQRDLAEAGVPVIPTTWIGPNDDWEPPTATEFVVKPAVSAGGRSTARYVGGDRAALAHVHALQAARQTVMVQEYVSAIDEKGELDVIFIDGCFSHAVVKYPVLRAGEGVVDRPWERMAWDGLAKPNPEQLAVAELTMRVICDLLQQIPVYGRVDLVSGPSDSSLLLEVELIDPYLSLDLGPGPAARMARVLVGS